MRFVEECVVSPFFLKLYKLDCQVKLNTYCQTYDDVMITASYKINNDHLHVIRSSLLRLTLALRMY